MGFVLPILISAVLVRLSFTRVIPGTLIFFAFIPLFSAAGRWSRMQSGFAFFFTGLFFYFSLLGWMHKQTWSGMIAIVIYCSLFYVPLGILTGNRAWNLISIRSKIILALIWSILEYLRSNIYTGFPWGILGSALHKETILIQLADITGIYGMSFLIMLINLLLASLFIYLRKIQFSFALKLRYLYIHFCLVLLLFSFMIIYGETCLMQTPEKNEITLHIGLIQPNIKSETKWNTREKNKVLSVYKTMSLAIKDVDLLIWPESVLPGELFYDSKLLSVLAEIIDERKAPILLGSGNISFEMETKNGRNTPQKKYFNSAYLMGRDKKIKGIYDKIKLVPFGEYIPFQKYIPNTRHLTPIEESYQPGKHYTLFFLNKENKTIPFSSVICIEDIYPHFVRKFVKQGALFIVTLTNDGWYSSTPCAYQHFSLSVLRAVENRVPFIRCANTGISAIITPKGDIVRAVTQGKKMTDIRGSLKGTIAINPGHKPTLYTRYGDVFILFSALCVVLYLFQNKIQSMLRKLKRRYFRKEPVPRTYAGYRSSGTQRKGRF